MNFRIGDSVFIKSKKVEGIITSIIDKKVAMVAVDNISMLVFFKDLAHPYFNMFHEKNKEIKSELSNNTKPAEQFPKGISLIFYPIFIKHHNDESIEKVKIFINNKTEFAYNFNIEIKIKNNLLFEIEKQIEPEEKLYLHELLFDEIAISPEFQYQFTNEQNTKFQIESKIVLKPKKLIEFIEKIKKEGDAFFTILLFEKLYEKPKIVVTKSTPTEIKTKKRAIYICRSKILRIERFIIDLHLEKLATNVDSLSSSEKLALQLNTFEKELDFAYATHQHYIIFIHGVGNGVLKNEIHKLLRLKIQTNKIKSFSNEYDYRFGFGATEVFL